jgi:hypothetical protein
MVRRGPALPPTIAQSTRQRVLEPFVAAIEDARPDWSGESEDQEDMPLCVPSNEVTVDPWTRERLDLYFQPSSEPVAEADRIVTQGVALLVKCAADVPKLELEKRNSPGECYAFQAELMLDAAIGTSLVKDIQLTIDTMLSQGLTLEARNLSKFHHRVRNMVHHLRNRIDTDYRKTMEHMADQLEESRREAGGPAAGDATAPAQGSDGGRPEPGRPRPAPYSLETPGTGARKSAASRVAIRAAIPGQGSGAALRTLVLAGLLATTFLGLAAFHLPSGYWTRPDGELSPSALFLDGTTLQVQDRWPSLFVTVDAVAWERLSAERRRALVRHLADRLSGDRYSGVLIRSPQGQPLAEWIRTNGVRVLDRPIERGTKQAR